MKCPKCLGRLTPIKVGNVEVDRCLVCEGVWFDPGELEEIMEKYSAELQDMNFDNGAFDGSETECHKEHFNKKTGKCPVCETDMKQKTHEDVTVDMCPQWHGVWLDGGEVLCLAKVKNMMSYYDVFKYMFSKETLKDIAALFRRNKKNKS